MSAVAIDDVIRCSSEDPQFPVSNLIKNNGKKWLSVKSSCDQSIEVELQLQKAVVISFIDIGNCGSHTTTVLVSHSMRSPNEFKCLLPAFTFMSVQESKQGVNKTKVEMFTKDDFMNNTKEQLWDRVKIVCCQPYGAGRQFGLSFFNIKTMVQPTIQNCLEQLNKDDNNNQSKLKSFFSMIGESPVRSPRETKLFKSTPITPTRSSLIKKMGNSCSIEKKQKRQLTPAARTQFLEEVDCFLEDIKFDDMIQDKQVKVSDLRCSLEKQRGERLFKQQKLLFMQIIAEKINCYKQSLIQEKDKVSNNPVSNEKEKREEECPNCHIRLPAFIISTHIQRCSNRKQVNGIIKRKNRNSLCFDLDSSSDDENSCNLSETIKSKRKKLSPSATPKKQGSFSSLTESPKGWDENVICLQSSSDEDEIWNSTPVSRNKQLTSKKLTPSSLSSASSTSRSSLNIPSKQTTPTSSKTSAGTAFLFRNSNQDHISTSQKCSIGQEWVSKGNVSFPELNGHETHPLPSSSFSCSKTSSSNSHWRGKRSGSFSKVTNASRLSDDIELQAVSDPYETYLTKQAKHNSESIKSDDHGVRKQSKKSFSFDHHKNRETDTTMEVAKNAARNQLQQPANWSDPKSGITLSNISSDTSKRLLVATENTQKCPICFEEIPKYDIGIHASLCDGKKNDDVSSNTEFEDKDAELAECPICSVFMHKDIINVHVNHCLDTKS